METGHGAPDQQPDARKLAELMVYIATRSDEDLNFGVTKRNEILFYSDFIAYSRHERSITGFEYVRLPFGPCPKGGDAIVRRLEVEDRILVREVVHFTRVQRRVLARKAAELTEAATAFAVEHARRIAKETGTPADVRAQAVHEIVHSPQVLCPARRADPRRERTRMRCWRVSAGCSGGIRTPACGSTTMRTRGP
jgi:hypothetical protein